MKKILLLIFIFIVHVEPPALAQGNLLITPKRIVFEGGLQKTELNMVNIGRDTATYSLSFIQYNMTEQGTLESIKQPTGLEMFADPYLRIFPRRVTLAPNEAQIVQLQLVRRAGMKSGEYRSHLWLRNEEKPQVMTPKSLAPDSGQMSVSLTAIIGVTIPVIVRIGAVGVKASLSDLRLETVMDTLQQLTMTLNRIGNISIYGKVVVEWIPLKGKPFQVGTMNAGIYTNLDKRVIAVHLNRTHLPFFTNGKLKVRYINTEENRKPLVYAEEELTIR